MKAASESQGMHYLDSLSRRWFTIYLPIVGFLIVLLFPFYWMALTAIKPDDQLLDLNTYNPFWTWNPTFKHIHKLLFESYYPLWLWNTMYVAIASTILSIIASVFAAYAIVRLAHLVLYALVVAFLSFTVTTYLRFRDLETNYTRLARKIALSDVKAPPSTPDDPTS